ncbi:hypothetical protein EPN52_02185 [bacterium]|nr:MAG: hypothetical protein EPN52_02185 [bacterium]
MAMRPVDLQLSILQATQTAAVTQQQQEGPVAAQAATQQQFAARVQERQESVGVVDEAEFSRIRADEREAGGEHGEEEPRQRHPEARVRSAEGPAFADDEHLIDFSA